MCASSRTESAPERGNEALNIADVVIDVRAGAQRPRSGRLRYEAHHDPIALRELVRERQLRPCREGETRQCQPKDPDAPESGSRCPGGASARAAGTTRVSRMRGHDPLAADFLLERQGWHNAQCQWRELCEGATELAQ